MNLRTFSTLDRAQLSRETLELSNGDIVRLPDAEGVAIFVRVGTAWITQHGDHDDHVIAAGETFMVDRAGFTLVAPLGGATVTLSAPPQRARTCRIERVQRDGQRYPVLCGRPSRVPTDATRLAPAL